MSVPANIVEGSGQLSAREFARFLRIALNSATETEYHIIAARDTGAMTAANGVTLITQLIEVRKMLYGLLRYLNQAHKGEAAVTNVSTNATTVRQPTADSPDGQAGSNF